MFLITELISLTASRLIYISGNVGIIKFTFCECRFAIEVVRRLFI